jgi:hypothetical protein
MNEIHENREPRIEHDPSNRDTPTQYDAQILKLRLPEQDALKNEAERCSADPRALNSVGRAVGQQVRITRKDDPRFIALYTVKQANPPADLNERTSMTGARSDLRQATAAEEVRLGAGKSARLPPCRSRPAAFDRLLRPRCAIYCCRNAQKGRS